MKSRRTLIILEIGTSYILVGVAMIVSSVVEAEGADLKTEAVACGCSDGVRSTLRGMVTVLLGSRGGRMDSCCFVYHQLTRGRRACLSF